MTFLKKAPLQASPVQNAYIWQGFEHNWTYNHRLNRLGDYIVQADKGAEAQLCHTAATGLGADKGTYTSYYTALQSPSIWRKGGLVELHFTGTEADYHAEYLEIVVSLPPSMNADSTHWTAILNGFDIVSNEGADKLQYFHLAVSEAMYIPNEQAIRFCVDAALVVNCRSLECHWFSHSYDYTLTMSYLLLADAKNNFQTTSYTTNIAHQWNSTTELSPKPYSNKIQGAKNEQFNTATIAFQSVSLNLDMEHWFLNWHAFLNNYHYAPSSGVFGYQAHFLFKQWDARMKKHSAYPNLSRFSMKKGGNANWQYTACLLQCRDATLLQHQIHGACEWQGNNNTANSTAAVQVHPIKVNN